jgi:hypothetical protein
MVSTNVCLSLGIWVMGRGKTMKGSVPGGTDVASSCSIACFSHADQKTQTVAGTVLYVPLPHAKGYTVLREILLVSDHNAYHIGEFAVLRQVMDT